MKFLAISLCLFSFAAMAQNNPLGPNGQGAQSGAFGVIAAATGTSASIDAVSAAGLAPKRTRMTVGIGGMSPGYDTYGTGSLFTFLEVVPIQAPAYASRVVLFNGNSGNYSVNSVSVYFSDSYSGFLLNGPGTAQLGNNTTIPTANSVYATCSTTSGSTTVTCPSTAGFPTTTTMYAIGLGMPVNVTATVTNSTTVTLSSNATVTNSAAALQFANIATDCKMYWDNAGADSDTINTSGSTRAFQIAANPSSSATGVNVFTAAASDFVPCTSVARTDGGSLPLAFIYVTLSASATEYGKGFSTFLSNVANTPSYDLNIAPTLQSGRYVFVMRPWNNGGSDYADNPGGTGYTSAPVWPLVTLQYLTDARGFNVLSTGDSISAAPPDDVYSNVVMRACYRLSTPQLPCEYSSFAYGGQASPIYMENFRNYVSLIQPSAIVGQPISRNDIGGLQLSQLQTLLAKYESYAQNVGARLGFLGAFPMTTTADGNATYQNSISTMRARLAAISQTCQPSTGGQSCPLVPVLDPVPIISRAALGGNFWDYLGLYQTANGATAAGATSIPVSQTSGIVGCYSGDVLTDTTTPSAISSNASVTSATATSLTVPSSTVVGSGIVTGDVLVCSYPGWTGGYLTKDNTHPWYPAITLLQSAGDTFLKQLLGLL